jgi:hypothetical protein
MIACAYSHAYIFYSRVYNAVADFCTDRCRDTTGGARGGGAHARRRGNATRNRRIDDDNEDNHIKILKNNSAQVGLPAAAVVTDPRKLAQIEYHDVDIDKDILIKYRQCYAAPSSRRQISTLFHKADASDRARLRSCSAWCRE